MSSLAERLQQFVDTTKESLGIEQKRERQASLFALVHDRLSSLRSLDLAVRLVSFQNKTLFDEDQYVIMVAIDQKAASSLLVLVQWCNAYQTSIPFDSNGIPGQNDASSELVVIMHRVDEKSTCWLREADRMFDFRSELWETFDNVVIQLFGKQLLNRHVEKQLATPST